MQVFKFGGASVKDANGVRNLAKIAGKFNEPSVIVVSAMGKTTNAMEELVKAYFSRKENTMALFQQMKKYHMDICEELFSKDHAIYPELDVLFFTLENKLYKDPSLDFNYEYDQVVSYGELFSTRIVAAWLKECNLPGVWLDIRQYLKTDAKYREAEIDWDLSSQLISDYFKQNNNHIAVTQGFIGATVTNHTTTLGREGSDFTAAILANILNAEKVVIWKDVPGILNADPQYFEATEKLNEISYREAIELSYSGAKVIHPKTIKPLENKQIPLHVKSFVEPDAEGTVIHRIDRLLQLQPVFILKQDQILLTISANDFSFIVEKNISQIFDVFAKCNIKVNMIQHSAINFSVAIDSPEGGLSCLIDNLLDSYDVRYNDGLELITIRHFNEKAIEQVISNRETYLEQKTRNTARFLIK
ncbi:aspartate kinase [Puteibacter caeruleilacunae]|nr:aspartate kinase [Puteibacter caeruleilacunae]